MVNLSIQAGQNGIHLGLGGVTEALDMGADFGASLFIGGFALPLLAINLGQDIGAFAVHGRRAGLGGGRGAGLGLGDNALFILAVGLGRTLGVALGFRFRRNRALKFRLIALGQLVFRDIGRTQLLVKLLALLLQRRFDLTLALGLGGGATGVYFAWPLAWFIRLERRRRLGFHAARVGRFFGGGGQWRLRLLLLRRGFAL